MHYLSFGTPQRDAQGVVRNAVLILHGTTGSGNQFLRPEFANELYGPGQPLDVSRFYLIIPDNVGHGKSSKPSDSLHAKFPKYGYLDMIEAQRQLLTDGLGVNHLRLIFGTSMGGMHAWLWGEEHPDFADALMPMASLPTQISGRNRIWRRTIIDAIRNDPNWKNDQCQGQPHGLRPRHSKYFISCPVIRRCDIAKRPRSKPPTKRSTNISRTRSASTMRTTYFTPSRLRTTTIRDRHLSTSPRPLLAINSADDLINPPELGVLEREIKRVPHGKTIVIPESEKTAGHGTHTIAAIWKDQFGRTTQRDRAFALKYRGAFRF